MKILITQQGQEYILAILLLNIFPNISTNVKGPYVSAITNSHKKIYGQLTKQKKPPINKNNLNKIKKEIKQYNPRNPTTRRRRTAKIQEEQKIQIQTEKTQLLEKDQNKFKNVTRRVKRHTTNTTNNINKKSLA